MRSSGRAGHGQEPQHKRHETKNERSTGSARERHVIDDMLPWVVLLLGLSLPLLAVWLLG
jgi:hypothetical protein